MAKNRKRSSKGIPLANIGAFLGILFAPQSGQEIRQNLSDKVDDLAGKVQEKVNLSGVTETASQTWNNVVEKGRTVANMGKQRVNESIEAGKRKFNESLDDVVER